MQAAPIRKDSRSITYRSVDKPTEMHIEMVRENVNTMASMMEFVANKHANKKCLGTRQILAEEDEVQPNGRVFKKVRLIYLLLICTTILKSMNISVKVFSRTHNFSQYVFVGQ